MFLSRGPSLTRKRVCVQTLFDPAFAPDGEEKRRRTLERAGWVPLGMEFKTDRVTTGLRQFLKARR